MASFLAPQHRAEAVLRYGVSQTTPQSRPRISHGRPQFHCSGVNVNGRRLRYVQGQFRQIVAFTFQPLRDCAVKAKLGRRPESSQRDMVVR